MTTSATAPSTCSPRSTSLTARCCTRPANATPARTCWRSSNGSTCTHRAHLDVHVVLDNLSAHKSEPVRKWLAHPQRARWHLHFTPTSLELGEPRRRMVLNPDPQSPQRDRRSPRSLTSKTPSRTGQRTGTTTPSPCAGPNPQTRSSPKSNEPETALTKTETHH